MKQINSKRLYLLRDQAIVLARSRGKTQQELADLYNISKTRVAQIERKMKRDSHETNT